MSEKENLRGRLQVAWAGVGLAWAGMENNRKITSAVEWGSLESGGGSAENEQAKDSNQGSTRGLPRSESGGESRERNVRKRTGYFLFLAGLKEI